MAKASAKKKLAAATATKVRTATAAAKRPVAAKVLVKPAKPAKLAKTAVVVAKAVPAALSPKPAVFSPNKLPPEPVRTDGKPKKNLAKLTTKDLQHYRDLLLAKRREILGDMSSMEDEALRTSSGTNLSSLPIHMADMGTDNYEQEFTLGLVEKDRQLIREINLALAKIQNGTYGICEGTGKPIGKPRLEAQPWARFGIEHARSLERRGVR